MNSITFLIVIYAPVYLLSTDFILFFPNKIVFFSASVPDLVKRLLVTWLLVVPNPVLHGCWLHDSLWLTLSCGYWLQDYVHLTKS